MEITTKVVCADEATDLLFCNDATCTVIREIKFILIRETVAIGIVFCRIPSNFACVDKRCACDIGVTVVEADETTNVGWNVCCQRGCNCKRAVQANALWNACETADVFWVCATYCVDCAVHFNEALFHTSTCAHITDNTANVLHTFVFGDIYGAVEFHITTEGDKAIRAVIDVTCNTTDWGEISALRIVGFRCLFDEDVPIDVAVLKWCGHFCTCCCVCYNSAEIIISADFDVCCGRGFLWGVTHLAIANAECTAWSLNADDAADAVVVISAEGCHLNVATSYVNKWWNVCALDIGNYATNCALVAVDSCVGNHWVCNGKTIAWCTTIRHADNATNVGICACVWGDGKITLWAARCHCRWASMHANNSAVAKSLADHACRNCAWAISIDGAGDCNVCNGCIFNKAEETYRHIDVSTIVVDDVALVVVVDKFSGITRVRVWFNVGKCNSNIGNYNGVCSVVRAVNITFECGTLLLSLACTVCPLVYYWIITTNRIEVYVGQIATCNPRTSIPIIVCVLPSITSIVVLFCRESICRIIVQIVHCRSANERTICTLLEEVITLAFAITTCSTVFELVIVLCVRGGYALSSCFVGHIDAFTNVTWKVVFTVCKFKIFAIKIVVGLWKCIDAHKVNAVLDDVRIVFATCLFKVIDAHLVLDVVLWSHCSAVLCVKGKDCQLRQATINKHISARSQSLSELCRINCSALMAFCENRRFSVFTKCAIHIIALRANKTSCCIINTSKCRNWWQIYATWSTFCISQCCALESRSIPTCGTISCSNIYICSRTRIQAFNLILKRETVADRDIFFSIISVAWVNITQYTCSIRSLILSFLEECGVNISTNYDLSNTITIVYTCWCVFTITIRVTDDTTSTSMRFILDTRNSNIINQSVWRDSSRVVTIIDVCTHGCTNYATRLNTTTRTSSWCFATSIHRPSVVTINDVCYSVRCFIFRVSAHNATGFIAVCNNLAWVVACIDVGTTFCRCCTNNATNWTVTCVNVVLRAFVGCCTVACITTVGDLSCCTTCTNDATDCGITGDCACITTAVNKHCRNTSSASCAADNTANAKVNNQIFVSTVRLFIVPFRSDCSLVDATNERDILAVCSAKDAACVVTIVDNYAVCNIDVVAKFCSCSDFCFVGAVVESECTLCRTNKSTNIIADCVDLTCDCQVLEGCPRCIGEDAVSASRGTCNIDVDAISITVKGCREVVSCCGQDTCHIWWIDLDIIGCKFNELIWGHCPIADVSCKCVPVCLWIDNSGCNFGIFLEVESDFSWRVDKVANHKFRQLDRWATWTDGDSNVSVCSGICECFTVYPSVIFFCPLVVDIFHQSGPSAIVVRSFDDKWTGVSCGEWQRVICGCPTIAVYIHVFTQIYNKCLWCVSTIEFGASFSIKEIWQHLSIVAVVTWIEGVGVSAEHILSDKLTIICARTSIVNRVGDICLIFRAETNILGFPSFFFCIICDTAKADASLCNDDASAWCIQTDEQVVCAVVCSIFKGICVCFLIATAIVEHHLHFGVKIIYNSRCRCGNTNWDAALFCSDFTCSGAGCSMISVCSNCTVGDEACKHKHFINGCTHCTIKCEDIFAIDVGRNCRICRICCDIKRPRILDCNRQCTTNNATLVACD